MSRPRQFRDGKAVVVLNPAPPGFNTFITSRFDDAGPPIGRGEGTQIRVDFAANEEGTKFVDGQFAEPVEVHDGEVHWTPGAFDFDDHFTLKAIIPATVVTPNGTGEGNCNLVPYAGLGNVIVPAAGNGTHDVDLATATPVPAGYDEVGDQNTGWWDLVHATGEVTNAGKPGKADWNLLDFSVPVNIIRCVGCGSSRNLFEVDVYMTEYIHPNWTIRFEVERNGTTKPEGKIGGWLMIFREVTT